MEMAILILLNQASLMTALKKQVHRQSISLDVLIQTGMVGLILEMLILTMPPSGVMLMGTAMGTMKMGQTQTIALGNQGLPQLAVL